MKKRETELDILRLLAALGVIFTHACGIDTESAVTRNIMTFLIATVTWHVPIFVMISGRFFLDPEREISAAKLRSAIGRLVFAFLFWNILYQAYYILTGTYSNLNWKGILSQSLMGPYHLWYLFMLVCLYAVTPFLRKIAEDRKLTEYFIALFLVFEFLSLYGPDLPLVGATVSQIMTKTNFHFALGYSGYFILGYYLRKYPLSGRKETALYILGITMFLFTGLATIWKTNQGAEGEEWFSKYLMPNVVIEAAALYTFFVNRVSRVSLSKKGSAFLSALAEYSFGVYLIHALILAFSEWISWHSIPANPILIVLLRVVFVFAASAAVTSLIRRIPFIGKIITRQKVIPMTKGFITIATGREEYYALARNLLRSYRRFCKDPLPFAILADRENEYTAGFDDVILFPDGASNSYLDKLRLAEFAPYDTTIFIDADCLAYGDLNVLFDHFEGADDFSCFGRVLPLDDKTGWFEYENLGDLQKQVSYVVGLHGGIYYMRKGEIARKVMRTAADLVPDYPKFRFKGKFDNPGDEPLVALSMALNQCRPIPFIREDICCYWEHTDHMQINIAKGRAAVDGQYDTILLHWGTRFTRELEYRKQIALLDLLESPGCTEAQLKKCAADYDRLIRTEKAKRFALRVRNKILRTIGIKT